MTFDPQELSENADYLQRLAQHLIPDHHAAEDAAQRVAAAYLRKRSETPEKPRAWMAGALRKERLKWLARARRRTELEAHPDQIRDPRSSEADVSSSELVDRIAQEVRALREPYRGVLWASLFEDKSLADIARELNRPDATVRSQHMRGLEQLRRRLDRSFPSREAWIALLLPFHARPSPAGDGAQVPSLAAEARRVAAWLVVPAALTGLALWFLRPSVDSPAGLDSTSTASAVPAVEGRRTPTAADTPLAESAASASRLAQEDESAGVATEPDATPGARRLPVRVVDAHGVGVAGAEVIGLADGHEQLGSTDPAADLVWTRLAVTDALGTALVEVPPEVVRQTPEGLQSSFLFVQAEGYQSWFTYRMRWPSNPELDADLGETRMLLHGDLVPVRVRVLGEDGELLDSAWLRIVREENYADRDRADGMLIKARIEDLRGAGREELEFSLPKGGHTLMSWAPGHGIAIRSLRIEEPTTITLPPPERVRIHGRVLDAEGRPLPGTLVWQERVDYGAKVPMEWVSTTSDAGGEYTLHVERTRYIDLWAGDPADQARRWVRKLDLMVDSLDDLDLVLGDSRMISVRLVDEARRPLARWATTLQVADGANVGTYKALTDADGRVAFPSPADAGLSLWIHGPAPGTKPARLVLRDLTPGADTREVIVPNADVELAALLGALSTPGWTAPDSFELVALEPGSFVIGGFPNLPSAEPFAIEQFSPGTVHLSLRIPPSLGHDLGSVEFHEGSFHDLGEIVLDAPVPVTFTLPADAPPASELKRFELLLRIGSENLGLPVVRRSDLPTDEVLLLPGGYRALVTDRQGQRSETWFEVSAGQPLEVPLAWPR